MKIVILMLLASSPILAQIPYSGKKIPLKTIEPTYDPSQLLPKSSYRILRTTKPDNQVDSQNQFNYKMPVKELSNDGYGMPFKKAISFDEMNADFYFDQKRTTISDIKK